MKEYNIVERYSTKKV